MRRLAKFNDDPVQVRPQTVNGEILCTLMILTVMFVIVAIVLIIFASPVAPKQEVKVIGRSNRLGTDRMYVGKESGKIVFVKDEGFDQAVAPSTNIVPSSTKFYQDHTFIKMLFRVIFSHLRDYSESRVKILKDIVDKDGKIPSKSSTFIRKTKETIWTRLEVLYSASKFSGSFFVYESADYQTMTLISTVCKHESHIIFLEMNKSGHDAISTSTFKHIDGGVVLHHYPAFVKDFDQSKIDKHVNYVVTDVLGKFC